MANLLFVINVKYLPGYEETLRMPGIRFPELMKLLRVRHSHSRLSYILGVCNRQSESDCGTEKG
jgi:hypothetical protein